jgi:hypothetical protein
MIEAFWDTINTEDFLETGFANIASVKKSETQNDLTMVLRIQMAILEEPGIELSECWELVFSEVQDSFISLDPSRNIKLLSEHCLLWHYEQPRRSLVLSEQSTTTFDIERLIGRLYLKHQELVGAWIPFEISPVSLTKINEPIVTVPEKLALAYEAVLIEAGIQCYTNIFSNPEWYSSKAGWVEGKKKFQIFLMDSPSFAMPYVVASELSGRCSESYSAGFPD